MKRALKLIGLAAAVTVALASCDLLAGFGVQSRIASFEADLNQEDRSDVYLNFSETSTENFDQIKAADFWESGIFAYENQPFEITVIDSSDPANVTATFSNQNLADEPATFVMVTDGMDWYIKQFSIDSFSTAIIRRP